MKWKRHSPDHQSGSVVSNAVMGGAPNGVRGRGKRHSATRQDSP